MRDYGILARRPSIISNISLYRKLIYTILIPAVNPAPVLSLYYPPAPHPMRSLRAPQFRVSLSLSPSMMHVSRLCYVMQHSDFNAMTNTPQFSKKRSRSSDWYALRNQTLVMMWYRWYYVILTLTQYWERWTAITDKSVISLNLTLLREKYNIQQCKFSNKPRKQHYIVLIICSMCLYNKKIVLWFL